MIAKPDTGLDTSRIFSDPALKRDTELAIIAGFADDPYGFGRNDLQPVAQALCPEIRQCLDWLASKGLSGRMTGSGSAVFAVINDGLEINDAPTGALIKTCRSLEHHPLKGW